jgi:hypothetical protein
MEPTHNERIEAFTQDGKAFIYFDLSNFKSNDDFIALIQSAKALIAQYPEKSLYTLTNIKGISFDSETKDIVTEWTEYNKPYVKYGVVLGVDGIKKIMVTAIFKLSGRKNMRFMTDRDKALAWLLSLD